MNYIWYGMIVISIIVSVIRGTTDATITAAFDGAKESVTVMLSLLGVMCFWTGLLKVAEKTGLSEKTERLLAPLIKFLFPNSGDKSRKYIAMNMSANLLGMGNAATPMGIKAMESLDGENTNPLYASDNMCMLIVVNTTSLQIIPSTILALRSAAGSGNPFSVMIPIWISSLTAVTVAVTAAKAYFGRRKKWRI